jgi:hypothetical protein
VVGAGARGVVAVPAHPRLSSSGAGDSGRDSRGGMAGVRAPLGAVAVAALVVAIFMPAAAAAQAPAPAPTSDGTPSLSLLPFFSSCNHIAIWTPANLLRAPGSWAAIVFCSFPTVTKISGVCRSGSFLN